MDRVRIVFEPGGETVEVEPGTTLHEAAAEAGVLLEAPCGGLKRCGACRVRVSGGVEPPGVEESGILGSRGAALSLRLACRARAAGPQPVSVALSSAETGAVPTETAAAGAALRRLEVEPPAERGVRCMAPRIPLGVVVDVGTTTLAAALVDLESGDVLATGGVPNSQVVLGHDVVTRVSLAVEGRAAELRDMAADGVARAVLPLLAERGASPAELSEAVVVGNTAMLRLLLGLDTAPLTAAPFEGAVVGARLTDATAAGLWGLGAAPLYVGPGVSAWIGSDATAGAIAVGLADRDEPTLLIDLGTNAELVLKAPDGLCAYSAPAGPALEGVTIERGMRAEPGAVERVDVDDGDLRVRVMGDEPPLGLCGTGVLDTVASMLRLGLLDADGRMAGEAPGPAGARLAERDGVRRIVIDPAGDVYLSQLDVRAVQAAVAAVATGIDYLLEAAGVTEDAVAEVAVAGGFGRHVRPASLAAVGIIPARWRDRVTFAGNAALEGGRRMLLSSAERRKAEETACAIRVVPTPADHTKRFVEATLFPAP